MIGATSPAQQIVQAQARAYLKKSNAPGCCIAVYDSASFGGGGYAYPLGLSGVPGTSPAPFTVTTDTVFEIGSVTKVFTSTLLAVAVEAGNATLSDAIGHWLNLNNTFSPDPVGSAVLDAILLVNFATHTSGMPDQPENLENYSQNLFSDQLPGSDLITYWNQYATQPPQCWQYSNIGFVTLGFAVTQMFPEDQGRNYNEMLANYVTGPLGMARTGAVVQAAWPAAAGCIGHWSKNSSPPPPFVFGKNTPTNDSAFDLKTTGDDMLNFLRAQLDPPDGLLGNAIKLTQTVQGTYPICGATNQMTMGLAWQISKDNGGHAVFLKNGATSQGGFEACVIFVPDLQCGVAVLSNQYFNASGMHPTGISPCVTASDIIGALHPGFEMAEGLVASLCIGVR